MMRLTLAALALLSLGACDRSVVQPPPPPPVPPAPPPPPPDLVVEILTPPGDTATFVGDSVEFEFRIRQRNGAEVLSMPFALTLSDSSVISVVPQPSIAHRYWMRGTAVGRTIAKVTAENVSDSIRITVAVPPPDPQPSPDYEVIDLGTLGGPTSLALGLNDGGEIVGSSLTADGQSHAFIWQDGVMRDLAPDLVASEASRISNSGIIGGVASSHPFAYGQGEHLLVWKDGIRTMLGSAGGENNLQLVALDENGDLVGLKSDEHRTRAAIWVNGQERLLGGLSDIFFPPNVSTAFDMNPHQEIVGASATWEQAGDEIQHAFIWENGVMRDLGLLADRPCETFPERVCGGSAAYDINNNGVAVGVSSDGGPGRHGVRWSNGAIQDLGHGWAIALNDAGDVIGYRQDYPIRDYAGRIVEYGGDDATIWRNDIPQSLGSLGGAATKVVALNEAGIVTGVSLTAGHRVRPFVWEPNRGMMALDMGSFTGRAAIPMAINSRGDVIGYTATCTYYRTPAWATTDLFCSEDSQSRAILWRRKSR